MKKVLPKPKVIKKKMKKNMRAPRKTLNIALIVTALLSNILNCRRNIKYAHITRVADIIIEVSYTFYLELSIAFLSSFESSDLKEKTKSVIAKAAVAMTPM